MYFGVKKEKRKKKKKINKMRDEIIEGEEKKLIQMRLKMCITS